MIRIVNNNKRNDILIDIYCDIREVFGNDYKKEVKRYYDNFKNELDYNIAQYGNLLIYYYQIREYFNKFGYTQFMKKYKQKSKQNDFKISDDKVWEYYKQLVREVANYILENE